MTQDELIIAARAAAAKYNLPQAIVCAIVERESGWNPWKVRYEPAFYEHYVEPLWIRGMVKDNSEAHARSISWGLMQVMGQVAREMRFTGELASLCDPAIGLEYGCRVFMSKLSACAGDVALALASYNGGGNPKYAAEVQLLAVAYELPPPDKAISA
jgi:soluble lytic murein transglycosylase-like protein